MSEINDTNIGAHEKHWFVFLLVRARHLLLLGAVVSLPLVSSFSMNPHLLVNSHLGAVSVMNDRKTLLSLHATPNGARSSSSTARDSAVHVEWEPVPELQRRIEDGIYYEHWRDHETHGGSSSRVDANDADGGAEEIASVQGVFFGYRVTREEYTRLKSADPDDLMDDYDI